MNGDEMYAVALDVEATGDMGAAAVASIGVAAGIVNKATGAVVLIETCRINVRNAVLESEGDGPVTFGSPEWLAVREGCRKFWAGLGPQYVAAMREGAVAPAAAAHIFHTLVRKHELEARARGLEFGFVTDNPLFDGGLVGCLAAAHGFPVPPHSCIAGEEGNYGHVYDIGSTGVQYALSSAARKEVREAATRECPHTHMPEQDAHHHLVRFGLGCARIAEVLRQGSGPARA